MKEATLAIDEPKVRRDKRTREKKNKRLMERECEYLGEKKKERKAVFKTIVKSLTIKLVLGSRKARSLRKKKERPLFRGAYRNPST